MSKVDTSAEAIKVFVEAITATVSMVSPKASKTAERLAAFVSQLAAERDEARAALGKCVIMLDALRSESGRGLPWGAEDCFRRGEWFDEEDVANIEAARAILAKAESRT